MEDHKEVHNHLDAAKEEIKSAADALATETKDKAKEVVANIASSISNAADKIHAEATKGEDKK